MGREVVGGKGVWRSHGQLPLTCAGCCCWCWALPMCHGHTLLISLFRCMFASRWCAMFISIGGFSWFLAQDLDACNHWCAIDTGFRILGHSTCLTLLHLHRLHRLPRSQGGCFLALTRCCGLSPSSQHTSECRVSRNNPHPWAGTGQAPMLGGSARHSWMLTSVVDCWATS